jgi:ectoine hydroxylase-related dioxygenase (phytanoyl-CoA dioxygenase family)
VTRLNTEPEILRVVAGLLQGAPRLFHSTLTSMTKAAPGDKIGSFHRDDSGFRFAPGFRNPHNDYQVSGHEIYCSHVSTWLALADVPEGTGFCLCPGTHKSLIHEPAGLLCQHDPPTSITLPMAAGDCAIFSTALLHDAAAWTQDYNRVNMFQRYTLSAYFQEENLKKNPDSGLPHEGQRQYISEEMYELESMGMQDKAAVRRMREYFKATQGRDFELEARSLGRPRL